MSERSPRSGGSPAEATLDRLLSPADRKRILDKIGAIEQASSGEVRVHVTDRRVRDPLAAAERTFAALGMTRTRLRNGVLVFLSLPSRRFAIVGDEGFDQAAGPEFWEPLRDALADRFAAGHYADGLLEVLERVQAVLSQHFPHEQGDLNELPDEISFPAPRRRGLAWIIVTGVAVTAGLLFLSWRLFFSGWS